jgi:hypothetical protein
LPKVQQLVENLSVIISVLIDAVILTNEDLFSGYFSACSFFDSPDDRLSPVFEFLRREKVLDDDKPVGSVKSDLFIGREIFHIAGDWLPLNIHFSIKKPFTCLPASSPGTPKE